LIIVGDTALADTSVPAAGEPGDAAFDHGPVLLVGLLEFDGFGLTAGGT